MPPFLSEEELVERESMGEFEGEYRSPGYWLDREERKECGMCPDCGEYLITGKLCPCVEDRGFESAEEAEAAYERREREYTEMEREYRAADQEDAEEGKGTYA